MFLILKFRISCKSTRRGVPFCDRDYSKNLFFFFGFGGGAGGAGVATHAMRQLGAIAAAVLGKL